MKVTVASILAAVVALTASGTIYLQALVVTGVSPDDNTLTLVSSAGYDYVYAVPENTLPDYSPGDLLSAIMFNPYTPNDSSDDQVMSIRNSGFSVRFHAERKTAEITLMSNKVG